MTIRTTMAVLAAFTIVGSACADSQPGEAGSPDAGALTVVLAEASVEECGSRFYRAMSIEIEVENTGDETLTLSSLEMGPQDGAVTGTQALPEGSTVPPGEKRLIVCSDGFAYDFCHGCNPEDASATVAYRNAAGATASTTAAGKVEFYLAWDFCDTFAGQPQLCKVVPAP